MTVICWTGGMNSSKENVHALSDELKQSCVRTSSLGVGRSVYASIYELDNQLVYTLVHELNNQQEPIV